MFVVDENNKILQPFILEWDTDFLTNNSRETVKVGITQKIIGL